MVVADLEAFAPLATNHFALTGGVAGIFERKGGGGRWVTQYQTEDSHKFSPADYCLFAKKRLTKGGGRHLGTPFPRPSLSHAPVLLR